MVPCILARMARCTAPVRGHRTASAEADCPACGSRYGRYSSSSYGSYSSPSPFYSASWSSGGGSGRSSGGSSRSVRPRWSRAGSVVLYTPEEVRALTPVRENVEKQASLDLRDVFLCHAGATGRAPPSSCTICSSRSVSRSGSARRTSPSARRCSAPSTRAWRTRGLGSCW